MGYQGQSKGYAVVGVSACFQRPSGSRANLHVAPVVSRMAHPHHLELLCWRPEHNGPGSSSKTYGLHRFFLVDHALAIVVQIPQAMKVSWIVLCDKHSHDPTAAVRGMIIGNFGMVLVSE